MSEMGLESQRIDHLVGQDYVRASVLNYFGIQFYDYSEMTLKEVCLARGLNVEQVVQELERPLSLLEEENLPLVSYPIDLIIEYLKHAHYLFVKRKLPFISKLIENFKTENPSYAAIAKDLRTLFPLFVEDFIHHIYQEEDTLFSYIHQLERARQKGTLNTNLYYLMESHSLQRFSIEHEVHDDEMAGIRRITNDYHSTSETPLHVKVLYCELTRLEKSLQTHARIENHILFPKAMTLEGQVRQLITEKVKFN